MKKYAIFILLLIFAMANVVPAEVIYEVIDLGTLGGNSSQAKAINDSGQVVGWSRIGTAKHAFLYNDGVMTDLGTLGGTNSHAHDINNSGQVVGNSQITTGDSALHAFLYDDGVMTELVTLGGTDSYAYDINNSGQVVGGSAIVGDSALHAFLYDDGVTTDLGTLGGTHSHAEAINDSGQVVGGSRIVGDSAYHAFLYDDGVMTNLGTLGGTESQADAINDSGQVVGVIYGDSVRYAFLYDDGVMTDLGTLGGTQSYAKAINNSGQVVGFSYITGDSALHAFLYDDGVMIDLNTLLPAGSGWVLKRAYGINDSGQIVGTGAFDGYDQRAFLMHPFPPKANAGPDHTVTDSDDNGNEQITLDGSASTDSNGTIVSWVWIDNLGNTIPDGEIVTAVLSVGVHTITLTVTDDDSLTNADTATITVHPAEKILTIKVDPNDIGINTLTPALGAHTYWKNQTVNVNAEPFPDCPHTWAFDHWIGDVVDPNASTTVIMDTDKTITAVFLKAKKECGDVCHPILQGDLNEDCHINMKDFKIYIAGWMECTAPECD